MRTAYTNTTPRKQEKIIEKKDNGVQTPITFMGDTLYKKMDDDDVKMLPDRFKVE